MTTLDFISAKHQHWRGGIKLKLQFVCSPFNTARFFLGFHYGVYAPVIGLTLDEVTSMYGAFIDLNAEQHEFEFVMDYMSSYELLNVPNRALSASEFNTCGQWSLWVVNPVVAPQGTPSDIAVNIWIAGAEDFQLFTPCNNNSSIFSPPFGGVSSSFEGEELLPQSAPIHVLPDIAPVTGMPYGPHSDSIMTIMKRYGPPRTFRFSFVNNSNIIDIGALLFGNNNDAANSPFYNQQPGVISYYGSAFRGVRGTVRLRFQMEMESGFNANDPGAQPNSSFSVAYSPEPYNGQIGNPTTPQMQVFQKYMRQYNIPTDSPTLDGATSLAFTTSDSNANYLNVEIPYEQLQKFAMIFHGSQENTYDRSIYSSLGSLYIRSEVPLNDIYTYKLNIWVSAGDDFRFGLYQGPPPVKAANPTIGTDVYY